MRMEVILLSVALNYIRAVPVRSEERNQNKASRVHSHKPSRIADVMDD